MPATRRFRVNQEIIAPEVRLIGESGEQLGVMPVRQALQVARERGADLVEVAANAVPPVCRLLDYGKFRYEQAKRGREARRHQKSTLLKEVRLRPKTSGRDLDFKALQARRHLSQGDKVKVTVRFRGRETSYPDIGRQQLVRIIGALQDVAVVEGSPSEEGRQMSVILAPSPARSVRIRERVRERDTQIAEAEDS